MRLFKNHSRFLAMVMALVLCFGMLPGMAHAEDSTCAHETAKWENNDDGHCSKVCTTCGKTVEGPSTHDWEYEYIIDGPIDQHAKRTCKRCGTVIRNAAVVGSTHVCKNNLNDGKVTTPATCTTTGTKTYSCRHCGDVVSTETIPVDPNNHTWDNGEVTTPATCKTKGVKTFTCTECGNTKTEDIPLTDHNFVRHGTGAHKAPTCKEAGYDVYWCTVCHETENREVPATNDHVWDEGEVTTKATCGQEGVKTFTCTVCTETKTESISATGNHTVTAWSPLGTDTAKHGGRCDVCGQYVTEYHTWGPDATCTEDQTCTVCGAVHEARAGHVPVTDPAVPATCEEDGLTEGEHCSVCRKILVAQSTVDALGHDYRPEAIADNNSMHRLICRNDPTHPIMMQTHTYGDWSDWVDNVRTRSCADCGYEQIDLRVVDVPGVDEPVVTPPVVTPPTTGGDDDTDTPTAPVTPVAPVTPAPAEDEDIDDNDTPLTGDPTDAEPAEEPVVEPAGEEDINDNETPLTNAPAADAGEDANVNAGVNAGSEDDSSAAAGEGIGDNDVPMADVPKTSDLSVVWYGATALSALGLTVLGKKKEENDG